MYSEETLKTLTFRITSNHNLSEASIVRFVRNAYVAIGAAGILAILFGLTTLFIPRSATAEWLSSGALAADGNAVLHDPTVNLLEAAVNPDPNPTKGDVPLTLSENEALVPGSSVPSDQEVADQAAQDQAAADQAAQDKADQEAAAAEKAATAKKAAAAKTAAKKAAAKTAATAKAAAKLPSVSGYFSDPLNGAGRLSQGLHGHNAVDISAPCGTPIYAAASGQVTTVKSDDGWNGGYGNYVVISHPNGTSTLYAHMTKVETSGGPVSKGEPIGTVGITGEATGCHLHVEVHGAKNTFRI